MLSCNMSFDPKYTITADMVQSLASIEVSRHLVVELPITASMIASLRDTARIASTHHSTAIEGNKLSLAEVREVINGGGHFPLREKDEVEVRNYYQALDKVDLLTREAEPIQQVHIQLLHGIAYEGKSKPTAYRDGQNIIRSGRLIVYIPPKASEVPQMMDDLTVWIDQSIAEKIPIPIIAALAHYQFATIHPYFDGNGRTARLLATLILHKYGYGLKGIYSLEEYYAKNLRAYYDALTTGTDEDYYDGNRSGADLTKFVDYFLRGMAESFANIRLHAQNAQSRGDLDQSPLLRDLSRQQKQVVKLFFTSNEIASKDIAEFFNLSHRQASHLCQKWVADGFLEIANPAPKTRTYKLNIKYETLVLNQIKLNH